MRVRLPCHLLVARPWRSAEGRRLHAKLDLAADEAAARDSREPEPVTPPAPPLVLATLTERTAKSGRRVLVGALNGCRLVVAPSDDFDRGGNRTWIVHLMAGRPAPASTVAAIPRLR
jgi:hypothetical protein